MPVAIDRIHHQLLICYARITKSRSCNGDTVIVDRTTAEIMEKRENEINHRQEQKLMKESIIEDREND